MKKLNIGVLMGGKSIEREVSLNSGRTICDHLDTARYNVIPLFQTLDGTLYILPLRFLHRGKTSDFEHRLSSEASLITWDTLPTLIDFMYIALHGRYGEDGCLQGFLEILKIPYCGSKVMASALGMNKTMQRTFLKQAGIDVPLSKTVRNIELANILTGIIDPTSLLENFRLPVIVKPNQEGSSLGVSFVTAIENLLPAIRNAATCHKGIIQQVIIEEYLEGMEFSCIVLTDHRTGKLLPLPPTEIVPEKNRTLFDYEQKYMPGRALKYTPARCSQEQIVRIQETCIQVMSTLGITNLARIDGFYTHNGRLVIIDPNTFAGMSPSSFAFVQAAQIGMSHTQLINHLIETELAYYNMLPTTTLESEKHMQNNKIRVAVLFGGRSNEKEISLESGRNIIYKLSPHNYTPIPLFVDSSLQLYRINQQQLVFNSTKEIEESLDPATKVAWNSLSSMADFVFIGLHGGDGENGCVQGTLEMLGIPYNGSGVLTSALCIDKAKTTYYLKELGFDVPAALLLPKEVWEQQQAYNLPSPFPLIVKPHDDGCSVLVHKVHNNTELNEALSRIFAQGKMVALIEEFIQGMELTVGVIGNEVPKALPPSQAIAGKEILSIEEKFLPGAGENQTPAPLRQHTLSMIKHVIEEAYTALECKGYARIDCFYQSAEISPTGYERVILLEVNTLPGMTPATCIFHQAAEINMSPMVFIDHIIKLGFEQHASSKLSLQDSEVTPADQVSPEH